MNGSLLLKQEGKEASTADLLIASICKHNNATLITLDKDFLKIKDLKVEFVKILSYVYRRAEALVFPTLVEGFGFPVLEAMDCGIPVITSNRSSLKEIGGNGAALLVTPDEPRDIARAMQAIVEKPNLRAGLVQAGFI